MTKRGLGPLLFVVVLGGSGSAGGPERLVVVETNALLYQDGQETARTWKVAATRGWSAYRGEHNGVASDGERRCFAQQLGANRPADRPADRPAPQATLELCFDRADVAR